MQKIGIVGTAKNTGKTTTLSFLLSSLSHFKKNIAVTGIGYDGEEIDNITLLPKPRLLIEKNVIAATSEKCFANSDVKFELLCKTGLTTALGEILIVQIIKPGLLVIAGPNKKSDLQKIIDLISKYEIDYLFIDGSLNRLSPMSVVDRIIFTTGAARNNMVSQLVLEMKSIEKIFSFPKKNCKREEVNSIRINSKLGETEIKLSSLLEKKDVLFLLGKLNQDVISINIPGLISGEAIIYLLEMLNHLNCINIEMIVNSPINLILATDFSNLKLLIDKIEGSKTSIKYLQKPELSAVTINPFYPFLNNFHYESGFINKDDFYTEMRKQLNTLVINVRENGEELIKQIIKSN
jgi:hypothetical protein